MLEQPDKTNRKPLVTVQFETEVDVATGSREQRMFVKMYFAARDSGLLATMPDDLWKTLCCLATYMDENSHCYPGQVELARHLGVRREAVNKRVQRLLDFRFNGRPVISVTRDRMSQGRYGKNHYTLHPISSFAIFDKAPRAPAARVSDHVRLSAHGEPTMCAPANMAEPHINKNQKINQNVDVNVRENPLKETDGPLLLGKLLDAAAARHRAIPPASPQPARLEELASLAADVLDDRKPVSIRTYRRQIGRAHV